MKSTTITSIVLFILCFIGIDSFLQAQTCADRKTIHVQLIFDASDSMDDLLATNISKLQAANNFAIELTQALDNTGFLTDVSLIDFCSTVDVSFDWTSPNSAISQLAGGVNSCGNTALYSAMVLGGQRLMQKNSNNLRLAIVLTDGADSGGGHILQNARDALNQGGILSQLIYFGSIPSTGYNNLNSIQNSIGDLSDIHVTLDLNTVIDPIVAATCENYRPDADIGNFDTNIILGIDNHTITFDASGSSDTEDNSNQLDYSWRISKPNGRTESRTGITTTYDVDDSYLNLGNNWSVRLTVEDTDGATHTQTTGFTVTGAAPEVEIIAPTEIDVGDVLTMEARNTLGNNPSQDLDGGNLSFRWTILEGPPNGSRPIGQQSTQRILSFGTTSEGDITTIEGNNHITERWKFQVVATDNEGQTSTEQVYVIVHNDPPNVYISGNESIDIGDVISLDISNIDDPDGGQIDLEWDLVQTPDRSPLSPQENYSSLQELEIPTDADYAGTWIFRLTGTDNEGESDEETIEVLVDGPPEVHIIGPERIGYLSFPLELDGSESEDSDSPCQAPDYCHSSSEPTIQISSGIRNYKWSILEYPQEYSEDVFRGSFSEVFDIPAIDEILQVPVGILRPGDWKLELEVMDHEHNSERQYFDLEVVDEQGLPTVGLTQPQSLELGLLSTLSSDIVLSGAQSFDLDNVLLGDALEPGLGITGYQWQLLSFPPGCTAMNATTSNNSSITLFESGSVIPIECLGTYEVELQVTDDDEPMEHVNTGSTIVSLYTCPQGLCLIHPTNSFPTVVQYTPSTDVIISYYLNSSVYSDPIFANGLVSQLELFHEDDPNLTIATLRNHNVLESNRGGINSFHWDGFYNGGTLPRDGLYNLKLSLLTNQLQSTTYQASSAEAIWLEVAELEIDPDTKLNYSIDSIISNTDQVTIDYKLTGMAPDMIKYIIKNQSGTLVDEGVLPSPYGSQFIWDARNISNVLVDPNHYTFEFNIIDDGQTIGRTDPIDLLIYRLSMIPASILSGTMSNEMYILANNNDDDFSGQQDRLEPGQEDKDVKEIEIRIEPSSLQTSIVLSGANTPGVRLWESSMRNNSININTPYVPPASNTSIFLETINGDTSNLWLSATIPGGASITGEKLKVKSRSLKLRKDTNNDGIIDYNDSAIWFTRIGLWENGYNNTDVVTEPWENGLGSNTFFRPWNNSVTDFIKNDPERFYVDVEDPLADKNSSLIDTVIVKLGILDSTLTTEIDDYTNIYLFETGANTGKFVSDSHLLVTTDFPTPNHIDSDDNFEVADGNGGFISDDDTNDRTHQTNIDGMVSVVYENGTPIVRDTVRVPVSERATDTRRILNVVAYSFNMPFHDHGLDGIVATIDADGTQGNGIFDYTDTNGNGQHDRGEHSEAYLAIQIDMLQPTTPLSGSHGLSIVPWGPIFSQTEIENRVKRADIAWAQAGIHVHLNKIIEIDAPNDATGLNMLFDGGHSISGVEDQLLYTVYGADMSHDTLYVFFTGASNTVGLAKAVTPLSNTLQSSSQMIEDSYCIITSLARLNDRTLAHEIGHTLTNRDDSINDPFIFFPADKTYDDSKIYKYRRISSATYINVRKIRPLGNTSAEGNQLLKSY